MIDECIHFFNKLGVTEGNLVIDEEMFNEIAKESIEKDFLPRDEKVGFLPHMEICGVKIKKKEQTWVWTSRGCYPKEVAEYIK